MARYHISKKGSPGRCRAFLKPCPLGPEAPHFDSEEAALKHISDEAEKEFGGTALQSLSKDESKTTVQEIEKPEPKAEPKITAQDIVKDVYSAPRTSAVNDFVNEYADDLEMLQENLVKRKDTWGDKRYVTKEEFLKEQDTKEKESVERELRNLKELQKRSLSNEQHAEQEKLRKKHGGYGRLTHKGDYVFDVTEKDVELLNGFVGNTIVDGDSRASTGYDRHEDLNVAAFYVESYGDAPVSRRKFAEGIVNSAYLAKRNGAKSDFVQWAATSKSAVTEISKNVAIEKSFNGNTYYYLMNTVQDDPYGMAHAKEE